MGLNIKKTLVKNHLKLFDTIVISQVFNYINYKKFLGIISDFHSKDGLIFVNNVLNYGIPQLFSKKRPRSIKEELNVLEGLRYKIINKKIIKINNRKIQNNDRLILVGRKI